MPYTYTDEDGDSLSMSRCKEGLHLVATSSPKAAAVGVCVASADLPKFVNEAIGWAHADGTGSDEDREFDARTSLVNHGVMLSQGRNFSLAQIEALAEVVKGWED